MKRITVNIADKTKADLVALTALTPKRSLSEEAAIGIENHIEDHALALKLARTTKKGR